MHFEAGLGIAGGEGVVEHRQQAGAEADDAHRAVLDPALAQAAMLDHGDDGFGLVVQHEAQRVGIMHGDVEHDAAAGAGFLMRQPCRCGGN